MIRLRDAINDGRRFSRREVVRLSSGLGLAATGLALGDRAMAAGGTSSGRAWPARFHQETPAAPAAAAPAVGPRPDGTRLWRVVVGDMDMDNGLELQAFFPTEITVNVGDAIFFDFGPMPGFHTITFLGGAEPFPLITPDPAAPTSQSGPPALIYNPAVLFPSGNPVYDGTGILNSGVGPLLPPRTFFTPTFTKPGVYDYVCIPHIGVMKARVTVQPKDSVLPHEQADYDQMAADQRIKLIAEGKADTAKYGQATSTKRSDGTTLWEATVGAGQGQAKVQLMLPQTLEITAGDTVRWVLRSPGEPHTVTLVGSDVPPQEPIIEPQVGGPPTVRANPQVVFPAGGNVYHGKGYINSGFLGKAFNGPETYELTFDTPGEFIYYCVLHGDSKGNGMAGKIKVAPR